MGYNGTWNVVFSTQAGNCSATNSVPFAVSGRRVSSAGGGKVTGGISRGVAQWLSEYRSACRGPPAAAGSPAIRGRAGGPGSLPATAAAAAGRRRGASFVSRTRCGILHAAPQSRDPALANRPGARLAAHVAPRRCWRAREAPGERTYGATCDPGNGAHRGASTITTWRPSKRASCSTLA